VFKSSLSSIFSAGVGRRILGLFLLAGILPVVFTAFLAYHEIGRGLEQQVTKTLRENSKSYGIDILSRLSEASRKAAALVRVIDADGAEATKDRSYLLDDFESVWIVSRKKPGTAIYGGSKSPLSASDIQFDYLAAGESQLLSKVNYGVNELILLRGLRIGQADQAIFAFRLSAESIWGPDENQPYMTDFCIFSSSGVSLYCPQSIAPDVHSILTAKKHPHNPEPTEHVVAGERHFAAMWHLFLDANFSHPGFDIVVSQPAAYALASSADFRRIFPPALALVVLMVFALSFNFIAQSLVPLQRLTIVARQYASGQLGSRVRVRTGDEFEALADAFNDMAARLERQIATFKAMSMIDKSILSGAKFEDVSEDVIGHLIQLTGFESAAVIAKDTNSPSWAKMISWFDGEFTHERVALPQEMGHEWCQPRQVSLAEIDGKFAPYKERFLSFGLTYAVLIPVVLNNDLKGMLLLGSDSRFEMQGSRLQRSVDLAGRLAVALASVEREEALYRQAHFDELTGLPNRQLLKDRLEQQLVQARREEQHGAILFLDLDRFKEINDVYGHSVGDVVLTQAAERIVAEVRDTDTVARLGGDEFVIVIPHLAGDNVPRMTATRILTRLGEPFSVRGTNHFLSASVGIVVFPEDGDSVETLLKNADAAMYRAKDAGRSRLEFFSKKLNAESRRKIELERDLRSAFDAGQLELYYQPQFSLDDGIICGAEALMRWRHDVRGNISPGEFVQLAEDSGLIVEMGRWVVDQTCADLRSILDMGLHPGSMSINVSTRQLREASFPGDVLDALQRHNIHPGYLQLEITETTVAQNRDTAIDILNVLREAGVQVAIDDFGTGYSSLSYLQQLPFDLIKVDRSFIELIGSGGNSENICRTIIKMAHELGKKAIAEGVETREQADFLHKNGCDSVQGYFYSHPLPQKEFISFVEKQDFHTQRRKALEIV
jgi:diguanylate cyclase (GGDEF)-like protein